MGFLGVYRALYDYVPQAEGELAMSEGDVLYVLDNNGDDGRWKAKKKAGADDDEEPEGLVPNNYVEPVSLPSLLGFSPSVLVPASANSPFPNRRMH